MTGTPTTRLSVVLPALDAAGVIANTVERLRGGLSELAPVEVLVVDDGSTDQTASIAAVAGSDQVIVLPTNQGKGSAIRAGVAAASGTTVVFTDADLAYDVAAIRRVVAALEAGADVAVGRRIDRRREPLVRRVGGALISFTAARLAVGRRFDTQCGLKGFARPRGVELVTTTEVDGFGFDVEVLTMAVRADVSIAEVDVVARPGTATSVRPVRHGLEVLREIVAVRRRFGAPRLRTDRAGP